MEITYRDDVVPGIEEIIGVYEDSGLNRPTHDRERMKKMFENSNLIVTAWDSGRLAGVARSLSDFCHCCYLADLAVRKDYQGRGIGKRLIEITKNSGGKRTTLLLLSAPSAMGYYPKVGFGKIENGFLVQRSE